MSKPQTIRTFEIDTSTMNKIYGDEIRELADQITNGPLQDIEDVLDDLVCDIKGIIGTQAANAVSDDEAESMLDIVDAWMTDNVSNAPMQTRIAAVYSTIGRSETRKKLGLETKTWKVKVEEIQLRERIYEIDAENEAEALEKAERGETLTEEDVRIVSIMERENPKIIG